jgi:hypothetical protein
LGDVEETVYVVEEDEDEEEVVKVGEEYRVEEPIAKIFSCRLSTRSQRCCLFEVCSFFPSISPECSGFVTTLLTPSRR